MTYENDKSLQWLYVRKYVYAYCICTFISLFTKFIRIKIIYINILYSRDQTIYLSIHLFMYAYISLFIYPSINPSGISRIFMIITCKLWVQMSDSGGGLTVKVLLNGFGFSTHHRHDMWWYDVVVVYRVYRVFIEYCLIDLPSGGGPAHTEGNDG